MEERVKELLKEMQREGYRGFEKLFVKTYQQQDISMHEHNFFELAYISKGMTLHRLDEKESILEPSDYFIIDYGSRHAYMNSENLEVINCLFMPDIIDHTLVDCHAYDTFLRTCLLRYYKLYQGETAVNRIFKDKDGRIKGILERMVYESKTQYVGYEEILKNQLMEIIILTMRKIVEQDLQSIKSDMVTLLIQFFKKHYGEKAALKRFYLEHHYSPQYVSRKFKAETGYTPNRYLQKIRIEKACELLSGTELAIYEVAEKVGYSDIKYFNDLFKRWIHRTPREYRKMN